MIYLKWMSRRKLISANYESKGKDKVKKYKKSPSYLIILSQKQVEPKLYIVNMDKKNYMTRVGFCKEMILL
jgi:hypothetical protein